MTIGRYFTVNNVGFHVRLCVPTVPPLRDLDAAFAEALAAECERKWGAGTLQRAGATVYRWLGAGAAASGPITLEADL